MRPPSSPRRSPRRRRGRRDACARSCCEWKSSRDWPPPPPKAQSKRRRPPRRRSGRWASSPRRPSSCRSRRRSSRRRFGGSTWTGERRQSSPPPQQRRIPVIPQEERDEPRVPWLGADRRDLGAERRRDVAEPGELDPRLWIERKGALALGRDGPAGLEHRHHPADRSTQTQPVGERRDPLALFPRADHFALDEETPSRIRTERNKWLDIPYVLPAEGRRRFDAQAHERP